MRRRRLRLSNSLWHNLQAWQLLLLFSSRLWHLDSLCNYFHWSPASASYSDAIGRICSHVKSSPASQWHILQAFSCSRCCFRLLFDLLQLATASSLAIADSIQHLKTVDHLNNLYTSIARSAACLAMLALPTALADTSSCSARPQRLFGMVYKLFSCLCSFLSRYGSSGADDSSSIESSYTPDIYKLWLRISRIVVIHHGSDSISSSSSGFISSCLASGSSTALCSMLIDPTLRRRLYRSISC